MRSNAAPSRDSATAAAVTAKTIWAIGTRCTGSGYAEDDQRESQGDGAAGERAQSALRLGGERLAGDGEGRSVGELDAAGHARCAPADEPHGCGESALRVAEERGERGGENRLHADRLGGRDIGRQDRERSPGEREPRVAVEASSEQLEVVSDRDEGARGDECEQPEARPHRDRNADRCGGRQRRGREG